MVEPTQNSRHVEEVEVSKAGLCTRQVSVRHSVGGKDRNLGHSDELSQGSGPLGW